VRKALAKEPGVAKVDVDLAQHRITVTFDASRTELDRLQAILADAGYETTRVA
jgi:copper chaperone CopZ